MATLDNATKSLRFTLMLADQTARKEGVPCRYLAHAAIEHFDAGDGGWWPLLALPPLWIEEEALRAFLEIEMREGEVPEMIPLAESLALRFLPGETWLLELGIDLGPWLGAAALRSERLGENVALIRLSTSAEEARTFLERLRRERQELRERSPA